jgi:hypothetical protein
MRTRFIPEPTKLKIAVQNLYKLGEAFQEEALEMHFQEKRGQNNIRLLKTFQPY